MKQYRTVNNLMGWLTFIIAATVYCLTIEPTASFWDCPEFITTGYKLEVGHPPGAPFFMLVANLFSQFASDVTTVAKMVNYMSALMSGACILFLFWSITHLVRKLIITDENNITKGQLITVMGSGLIGALVYTFSDTFWFSAVEGEVYAFSSLFTAVVFWLILKWEDVADQPHSDRWIILIAYLTGLSIGVHLLNLLCLPAIVLVYYYKKTPNATAKGSLIALLGSMVLVAAVLYGIVPGIVKVGGWFELLFVNGLGMSFNSGVVVYIILLAEGYHRDCFAFPGRVNDEYSKGCNLLIRENRASLLLSAEDFVKAMGWEVSAHSAKVANVQRSLFLDLSEEEQKVIEILEKRGDLQINTLVVEADIPVQKMNTILFELEMKGVVRVLVGGMYQLL